MPDVAFSPKDWLEPLGEYLDKQFTKQFTTSRALLAAMDARSMVKAGSYLLAPSVTSGGNHTGITDFYAVAAASNDTVVAPRYYWSWYGGPVSASIAEMQEAKGPGEMLDILQQRVDAKIEKILEDINADLLGTTDAAQNRVAGIPYAVQAPTSNSAFGGVERNGSNWWKSSVTGSVGALTLAKMNTAYNAMVDVGAQPQIILMPTDLYGVLEGLLQAKQQYINDAKMAQVGFESLLFKGASVVHDANAPSGTIFFLSKDIQLAKLTNRPQVEEADPGYTLTKGFKMFWGVSLTARALRTCARLNGVTVP